MLWHFYGDTFNQSGVTGVFDEMRADVNEIRDNPKVRDTVEYINYEIQQLVLRIKGTIEDNEQQPNQPAPEKPSLDGPSAQSFSVHNVELGDDRSEVEQQVGAPKRSSMNEYGVDWVAYHENYHNFFMVSYDEQNKVVGLYTNQDLLSSLQGISINSTRESVLSTLDDPLEYIQKGFVNYQLQNNQEFDTYRIDGNYVTIFYDKHENSTVTAIQIISGDLEQQKGAYFGEPSDALKEGFEYQLFDLTNATRVNHGLSVLAWDESVQQTVRDHSTDMADNSYFGHTNLQGQSPFDRLNEDNISYRMAGENLAAGQTSSIFAHEGLMNSIGHRENKLQADYKILTVGVAFDQEAKPFYTENYLTK